MMRPYAQHAPAVAHGVMFHHFHGGIHLRRQGSLSPPAFGDLLDYLAQSVELLPAGTWLERARRGRLGPRDVCLTFDDSLRCQRDLAVPELERRGLTAFFFVYSSILEGHPVRLELYAHFRHRAYDSFAAFYAAFLDALEVLPDAERHRAALDALDPKRYLGASPFYSDDERRFRYLRDRVLGPRRYAAVMDHLIGDRIAELEALAETLWMNEDDVVSLRRREHVIGLHSYSHPTDLAAMTPAQQRDEYRRNQQHLSTLLGEPVTTVAHPCGSYGAATLAILRALGVTVGFRADMEPGGGSGLEFPRQDHANVVRLMGAA